MLWYIALQAGPILEAGWFSVFHVVNYGEAG
jgi:hypothetical protein